MYDFDKQYGSNNNNKYVGKMYTTLFCTHHIFKCISLKWPLIKPPLSTASMHKGEYSQQDNSPQLRPLQCTMVGLVFNLFHPKCG